LLFEHDLFRKPAATFRDHALVRSPAPRRLFGETFVAGLYGFRTIVLERVPPCGGESILSYGLSYEQALRHCRFLSESVIRDQQDNTS
jgi:hypothetical protein